MVACIIVTAAFAIPLNAQSPSAPGRVQLKVLEHPPIYVTNEKYDQVWAKRVRNGIDVARDYLGNCGPVHVYVIGETTDELALEATRRELIEAFCACRHADTPEDMPDCRRGSGRELIEKSRAGKESEAYLSFIDYVEPPIAELVFTNVHAMGGPIETRGIHEYTHVFQMSHGATPTWLMEGGAEFMASYLGSRNGWCEFETELEHMLENLEYRLRLETEFKKREDFHARFGIHQMEDIDAATEEVKPYYWHLAYMTGTWAVAYLVHSSPSRSIHEFSTRFYALVDELGWEAALAKYTRFTDKGDFYEGFAEFIVLDPEKRRRMLDELKE